MAQKLALINNLYKEFTCTICLQLFNDPVTVSVCKHTFCQDCLKQWKHKSAQLNKKSFNFKCPLCKNVNTNRSYYTNEKYALAVCFLRQLVVYMDAHSEPDPPTSLKHEILERYLNECVLYQVDHDNDSETNLSLTNQSNLITESEENEFILNICSTAENINIIQQIESDFIDELEQEINVEQIQTSTPKAASKRTNASKVETPKTRVSRRNKDDVSENGTNPDLEKTTNVDLEKTPKTRVSKRNKDVSENETTSTKTSTSTVDLEKTPKTRVSRRNKDDVSENETTSTKKQKKDNDLSTLTVDLEKTSKTRVSGRNKDNVPENETTSTKKPKKDNDLSTSTVDLEKTRVSKRNKDVSEIETTPTKKQKKDNDLSTSTVDLEKTPKTRVSKRNKDVSENETTSTKKQNKDDVSSTSQIKENETDLKKQKKEVNELDKKQQIKDNETNPDYETKKQEKNNVTTTSQNKENETNTETKKQKKNDVTTDSSSIIKSGWHRLKTISKEITKTGKYKRLKVTETKDKKRTSARIKNKTPESKPMLDDFSIYLEEENKPQPCEINDKNIKNDETIDEIEINDDIFSRSTQILKLNTSDKNRIKKVDMSTQTDILQCPTCTFTFNLKSPVKQAQTCPQKPYSLKPSNESSEDFNEFLNAQKKDLAEKPQLNLSVISETSSEQTKKRFKRIRTPSDSDSDESGSKKSKTSYQSKLLYRDDIDVCFPSSVSQINDIKKLETTTTTNKSSEDTLLYLEQQYKNPINNEVKDTNLDQLLSGIDVSTFEDFTVTNKDKLSASLFTETDKNDKTELPQNKTNTENVDDKNVDDEIISDSCDEEMFEDDNIVDTTPQKSVEKINKTKSVEKSKTLMNYSKLELRKLQAVTSQTPDFLPLSNLNCAFFNPKTQTQQHNSNIIENSVPVSQNQQQNSNIIENSVPVTLQTVKNVNIIENSASTLQTVKIPEKTHLKPILMMQNEEYSPLQLIKPAKTKPIKIQEPEKQQSSILNYMTSLSPEQQNERCESPILHKRQIAVLPIICTSRLQHKENKEIMTCASRLNARFSNVFNENVTHLVVKVDENNCVVDQTIKYALAIAHGIWVVSYTWFKNSLIKNRLQPEDDYEVLDMSGKPGPMLSRLRRLDSPLFGDFVFLIVNPLVSATKEQLEDVVVSLGGEVIQSHNQLKLKSGKHYLILAEGKCCLDMDQYETWKDFYQIMVVDIEWLSETVGQYEMTSIRSYALCSDDQIESYGYPVELIAAIPESQMPTL